MLCKFVSNHPDNLLVWAQDYGGGGLRVHYCHCGIQKQAIQSREVCMHGRDAKKGGNDAATQQTAAQYAAERVLMTVF